MQFLDLVPGFLVAILAEFCLPFSRVIHSCVGWLLIEIILFTAMASIIVATSSGDLVLKPHPFSSP